MNNTNFTFSVYTSPGGVCQLDGVATIYLYAVMLIILAVVSSIENLLVIIVICKYEVLQSTSLILLGVLAVIDFITGSIVTPIKVGITLKHDLYSYTYQFLHAFLCLFWAVVFFSLSTVLLISIDRFLHVYYLEKYKLTKKKLIFGILVCWISPFVITLCWSLKFHAEDIGWFALVFFLFCIIAMIVAYIGMIISLKKHTSNVSDETRQTYIENQRQAVKTTLIIIITCIVMNGPPAMFIILEEFIGIRSNALCAIAFFCLLATSAVNPLIYCLRIPVMKKHILKFLRFNSSRENTEEREDLCLTVVADTNI
jgi:hypothetical protein